MNGPANLATSSAMVRVRGQGRMTATRVSTYATVPSACPSALRPSIPITESADTATKIVSGAVLARRITWAQTVAIAAKKPLWIPIRLRAVSRKRTLVRPVSKYARTFVGNPLGICSQAVSHTCDGISANK